MDLQTVRTPAGTMAVRTAGNGPAVLLVHGIPGSSRVWDAVSDGLVDAGFHVLAPDLLGFGASDRPADLDGLWLGAQATALVHVLDAADAEPAIVVGHDYGAPTAVMLARQHPTSVSSLALAAGNLFTDTPIPPPLNTVTWPLVGDVAERVVLSTPMLRLMLRIGVGRPAVTLDAETHLGDRGQRRAIKTIFSAALRDLDTRYAEVEAALASLRLPVTVLWGGRDPFFRVDQARRASDAIPGATLRVAADAGHFLPAERPNSLVEIVRQLHANVTKTTR